MKNSDRLRFRRIFAVITLSIFIPANFNLVFSQTNRGVENVRVKTSGGQTREVKLYDGSYALVIGNGNYRNWDNLPGVRIDVAAVEKALAANGFTVETAVDLNSRDLSSRIEQFINDYGYSKNNRLLVYFAGHGHTQRAIDDADERELGFIVPVDAPLPDKDLTGFFRKAVSLEKIRTFAREIQAKHAIFLFDSCFSGKLVSRNNIAVPPIIEESATYPVRQFITAGAANQPVPDESIFRRAFVRALEGEGDLNKDGYILGTELAAFLRDKVANASRRTQTPQYGVIDDIALDRGDFVFTVTSKNSAVAGNPDDSKTNDTPITARSRSEIEREAWSYIKNSTDPQDFRDFLKEFPDGANASNALIKLEQTAWDAVKDSRDKTRIQAYLNEFPNGTNAFLAKTKLRQIGAAANNTTPATATSNNTSANKTAGAISKKRLASGVEMSFAYIPAGEFQMGSTDGDEDEKPVHTVRISQGFQMQTTEVTQAQWEAVMGNNPSSFKNCPQCPVESVFWEDAQQFIAKLNGQSDGYKYRLPSEAEWEYAARAGTTTAFAFGNSLSAEQANFDGNYPYGGAAKGKYLERTAPVKSYRANEWGLYDMHGNVWEWVQDWKGEYGSGSVTDPKGPATGSNRVLRGGGWNDNGRILRSANRINYSPSNRFNDLGFRLVRD